jgi:hypothetical protein
MRDEWELDELISCWTLDEGDWRLLSMNRSFPSRHGPAASTSDGFV